MSPGIINAISSQDIFCESSSILCLDFFVSSTIPMTADQGVLHGTDPIKGTLCFFNLTGFRARKEREQGSLKINKVFLMWADGVQGRLGCSIT